MRAVTLTLVITALTLAACGSEDGAGPRGKPAAVLDRAPDVTWAAGGAQVLAAGPAMESTGSVDLRTGTAKMTVKGVGVASPFLTDPALALDVVRGVVEIDPFGGLQARGVGTIMYEVDVDPAKALAATPAARRERLAAVLPAKRFYADVFVDSQGRIRRVLLPVDLTTPRQYGESKITNEEMTVDFYDFPSER